MHKSSAIVSVVFGWCGTIVENIRRVNIIGLVEELCWLGNLLEIKFGNILHMLNFLDVALKFRHVGQACGQVFA